MVYRFSYRINKLVFTIPPKIMKIKCLVCNKSIKKFTSTNDWETRKYHLICFQKKQEQDFINMVNKIEEDKKKRIENNLYYSNQMILEDECLISDDEE